MRTSRTDGYAITRPRTHVLGNNCTVYADDCTLDGHHGVVHGERAIINGAGWRIMPSARATAVINNADHIIVGDAPPSAADDTASPPALLAPTRRDCARCRANPVGAMLVPCNHGTVCAPCAAEITRTDDTCPTCGTRAPRWRPLFF